MGQPLLLCLEWTSGGEPSHCEQSRNYQDHAPQHICHCWRDGGADVVQRSPLWCAISFPFALAGSSEQVARLVEVRGLASMIPQEYNLCSPCDETSLKTLPNQQLKCSLGPGDPTIASGQRLVARRAQGMRSVRCILH